MLKVLSRSSPLALVQVREVFNHLPDVSYLVKSFDTYGDSHKELSLLEPQKTDFFTDEIDRALLDGEGDVAIHSAKDLPWPLPLGLEVIALTECSDNTDSLVSRDNQTLDQLQPGALVGTSSPQRRENLLAIRPDIEIAGIRGNIQERIAQMDDGYIEAVIVATCALKRLGLESRIAQILPFKAHPLQGMLAVVAKTKTPELLKLFSSIDNRYRYGKVWIIGGGPGDPDLLTKKADKILGNADTIIYDDLISEQLLDSYTAQKIYVGKRKGKHSSTQDSINSILYENAVCGKRTIRLKGGDSLVFGRLGEEAQYLSSRFVPVEIVPGISSFQAAAADIMMPLTQRGLSDSVTLLSGHRADPQKSPPANSPTVAIFMGASEKGHAATLLREHGLSEQTEVALIKKASQPAEECCIVPLEDLEKNTMESPLMILAGKTVPSANLPRRILYTGLDSTECLLDGVIIHYPVIKTEPLRTVPIDPHNHDGLIFTSRVAVRCFFNRFGTTDLPAFAIGARTAFEIERYECNVIGRPKMADSESFFRMLSKETRFSNLLYPCSDLSYNALHESPIIQPVPVYHTRPVHQKCIDLNNYHGIVFSSSSTVQAFFQLYNSVPDHIAAFVYGKPTVEKLRKNGFSESRIITISPGGQ